MLVNDGKTQVRLLLLADRVQKLAQLDQVPAVRREMAEKLAMMVKLTDQDDPLGLARGPWQGSLGFNAAWATCLVALRSPTS
jgi:hypothetical protein